MVYIPLQDEHREAVRQLIAAFTEVFVGSEFGPAHITLSDYNALDDNLIFSRNVVSGLLTGTASDEQRDTYKDHQPNELLATLLFMDVLRQIPEEWRDIHAETVEDDD